MLPQGMFSVAIATVLFPTLSRLAAHEPRWEYVALCLTLTLFALSNLWMARRHLLTNAGEVRL